VGGELRVHCCHSGSSKGNGAGNRLLWPLLLVRRTCAWSTPCGAHTSSTCICPLFSCASHLPLAALSSRLNPSSVLVSCKCSSCSSSYPSCRPFFPLFAIALSLGSNLSWPLSALRVAVIATIFLLSGDLAPQSPLVFNHLNLHFADIMRAL
jgi:hypothetical protein